MVQKSPLAGGDAIMTFPFKCNVVKITVVENSGTDCVIIETDLPSSMPFWGEPLMFKFPAEHGTGAQYVRDNFHIEPDVIERI